VPVDLEFPHKFTYKLTYPDNVYFTPKLGEAVTVTDPIRDILEDYVVVALSNGGYALKRANDCKMYEARKVSDCKVDEKEILEILQEN